MAPGARKLRVTVIEAKGLTGLERDGSSDPYVQLELIDMKEQPIVGEMYKTKVKDKATAPTWDETFEMGRRCDLGVKGTMPTLRCRVFDKEAVFKDRPMGECQVNLLALGDTGEESDEHRTLLPFANIRAGVNLGTLRLRIVLDPLKLSPMNRLPLKETPSGNLMLPPGIDIENFVDGEIASEEAEEHSGEDPNLLLVYVIQARGLMVADSSLFGGGSSDPLVILNCNRLQKRTKVIQKSLEPKWDERFEIPMQESGGQLEVVVEDHDLTTNDFLGRVTVPMEDLKHKKKTQKWYTLLDKEEKVGGEPRGEIELALQWLHDPKAKNMTGGRASFLTLMQQAAGVQDKSSDTDDAGEEEPEPEAPKTAEEIAAEAKAKEDALQALKAELMDIEVKSGDYMIYIHIIEARDLKAEDVSGTSDPVVYIDAFGQKMATEVKKSCLSAVWDETFVISLRNLDKEEFEQGVIRLSISDADGPAAIKQDLIGAYSFDATFVYSQKDHELHRKWLALTDDENPEDSGVQGYLKASISIVGPGDKLKVHDEEADRRSERDLEAKAGGIDKMVLRPPNAKSEQQWLVVTAWKAEYLPVMDESAIGRAGGDFYFQVELGGGKPVKTKRKTMRGTRQSMCPYWRSEMWLPVSMPCMAGNTKLSVYEWDAIGDDELIGVVHGSVKLLGKLGPGAVMGPTWYPMYGAPLKISDASNMKRLGKRATMMEDVDWKEVYNNYSDKGSTYRGRLLLSQEIRATLPPGHEDERLPWRRKVKKLSTKREPATRLYAIRCFVVSGTEIPAFTSLANLGKTDKMSIRISIGKHELNCGPVDNNKGVCEWYEYLEEAGGLQLPAVESMLPDVLVQLLRGVKDQEPVCYCRIPAAELLKEEFITTPKWRMLGEDKVLDCLNDGEFPGSLLLKIGFGPREAFLKTARAWEGELQLLRRKVPYQIRVHVYQARDLPAADDNGLMDPFLMIRCLGQTFNTENFEDASGKRVHKQRETLDPLWYFTTTFDVMLPVPELKAYFPQVNIQVFDWDRVGDDDYCGSIFVPLGDLLVETAANLAPPPEPSWRSFFLEKPGDSDGQLLCSFQVVHKEGGAAEVLPPPPDITPEYRSAFLEIVAVGIRNVEPYQMLPLQLPYLEMEMDLPKHQTVSAVTNPSKKPSGANANFLERIKLPVELPCREIFAPRLKLRVRDTRLGGFYKPLVAAGAIDLERKLPWSATYEPPMTQCMDIGGVMKQAGAPVILDEAPAGGAEATAKPTGDDTATPGAAAAEGNAMAGSNPAGTAPTTPRLDSIAVDIGVGGVLPMLLEGSEPPPSPTPADLSYAGSPSSFPPDETMMDNGGGVVAMSGFGETIPPPSPMPLSPVVTTTLGCEEQLLEAMGETDTGVGVFPALLHVPEAKRKVIEDARHKKKLRTGGGHDMDGAEEKYDDEDDEEEEEGPPKYMVNRQILEAELEAELKTTPFESYPLFRGQKFGGFGGSDYKQVGKFKCIVRVTLMDPDEEPLFVPNDVAKNKEVLAELLKPKGYKVRLYVLRAFNLTPMDLGIGGRPGKSDPYLLAKLGKDTFNDVANRIDDVTDADIYRCVEFGAELPGASQLDVSIMDYDDIGSDELIGRTVIDLEDRWFDQRWQAMGMENRCEQDGDGKTLRLQTKPLETRALYVPTSNAMQGAMQCWVDILPAGDAGGFPADDVALPPVQEFELRLVIWKCKDVVSMDTLENMNDLFLKAWVEGCEPLETDTHWRAKKGKGSFNWRMKFMVPLGPRTRSMKFPYLTLQMWDKDIFKWNDCIAEGMIDLGKHFRKAYKKRQVVKLFQKPPDPATADKQQALEAAIAAEEENALLDELNGTGPVAAAAGGPEGQALLAPGADGKPAAGAGATSGTAAAGTAEADGSNRCDIESGGKAGGAGGGAKATAEEAGATPAKRRWHCFGGGKKKKADDDVVGMSPKEVADENERRREAGLPELTAADVKGAEEEGGDSDAKEFVQQMKEMLGMGVADPPESHWMQLERTNRETGTKEPMGQCCISISLWPVDKANLAPVGVGRDAPNNSPYLPPPTGRMKFSLNPFAMGAELFGPKLCAYIVCACIIVLVALAMVFLGPMINVAVTVIANS